VFIFTVDLLALNIQTKKLAKNIFVSRLFKTEKREELRSDYLIQNRRRLIQACVL
jgi:hypothetical protein